jgi:phosphatidylglycerophosphatase A
LSADPLRDAGPERAPDAGERSAKRTLAIVVATFGGAGFFPIASGTVGAAAALVLYAAVVLAGVASTALVSVQIAGSIALLFAGVWACTETEAIFGKDGGEMVVDEALGMLVSVAFLPPTVATLALAFVLFRVFDIVKPWPAGRCERMAGGWGVMLDDLVAGIYANIGVRAALAAWAAMRGAGAGPGQ